VFLSKGDNGIFANGSVREPEILVYHNSAVGGTEKKYLQPYLAYCIVEPARIKFGCWGLGLAR
jgi:hypothetical protein